VYSQALDSLDYEYQTLANFKYVASNVEFSLRKENLSFKIHEEVASLEPKDQKIWLDKAEQNNLTIRELRQAIKAHKTLDLSTQLCFAE